MGEHIVWVTMCSREEREKKALEDFILLAAASRNVSSPAKHTAEKEKLEDAEKLIATLLAQQCKLQDALKRSQRESESLHNDLAFTQLQRDLAVNSQKERDHVFEQQVAENRKLKSACEKEKKVSSEAHAKIADLQDIIQALSQQCIDTFSRNEQSGTGSQPTGSLEETIRILQRLTEGSKNSNKDPTHQTRNTGAEPRNKSLIEKQRDGMLNVQAELKDLVNHLSAEKDALEKQRDEMLNVQEELKNKLTYLETKKDALLNRQRDATLEMQERHKAEVNALAAQVQHLNENVEVEFNDKRTLAGIVQQLKWCLVFQHALRRVSRNQLATQANTDLSRMIGMSLNHMVTCSTQNSIVKDLKTRITQQNDRSAGLCHKIERLEEEHAAQMHELETECTQLSEKAQECVLNASNAARAAQNAQHKMQELRWDAVYQKVCRQQLPTEGDVYIVKLYAELYICNAVITRLGWACCGCSLMQKGYRDNDPTQEYLEICFDHPYVHLCHFSYSLAPKKVQERMAQALLNFESDFLDEERTDSYNKHLDVISLV